MAGQRKVRTRGMRERMQTKKKKRRTSSKRRTMRRIKNKSKGNEREEKEWRSREK